MIRLITILMLGMMSFGHSQEISDSLKSRVANLKAGRERAISKADQIYVLELSKLRDAAIKAGLLKEANYLDAEIDGLKTEGFKKLPFSTTAVVNSEETRTLKFRFLTGASFTDPKEIVFDIREATDDSGDKGLTFKIIDLETGKELISKFVSSKSSKVFKLENVKTKQIELMVEDSDTVLKKLKGNYPGNGFNFTISAK